MLTTPVYYDTIPTLHNLKKNGESNNMEEKQTPKTRKGPKPMESIILRPIKEGEEVSSIKDLFQAAARTTPAETESTLKRLSPGTYLVIHGRPYTAEVSETTKSVVTIK